MSKATLITSLKFEGAEWSNVSDDCKDLLRGMLERDQVERPSISDIIVHPFFR